MFTTCRSGIVSVPPTSPGRWIFFSRSYVSWSLDFFFLFFSLFSFPPSRSCVFYVTLTYWIYNIVPTTQLHHCLPFARTQIKTGNWYAYHVSFHSQFISFKYFYIPKQIFNQTSKTPLYAHKDQPTNYYIVSIQQLPRTPHYYNHAEQIAGEPPAQAVRSCTTGACSLLQTIFLIFLSRPEQSTGSFLTAHSERAPSGNSELGKRLRLSFQTIECTPCAGSSSLDSKDLLHYKIACGAQRFRSTHVHCILPSRLRVMVSNHTIFSTSSPCRLPNDSDRSLVSTRLFWYWNFLRRERETSTTNPLSLLLLPPLHLLISPIPFLLWHVTLTTFFFFHFLY